MEMESLFASTIEKLGIDATPVAILKEMKVPGLTRCHISSHLQKYRCKAQRNQTLDKLSLRFLIN